MSVPVHPGPPATTSTATPTTPIPAAVIHTDPSRNNEVRLAITETELAQAQRLRHEVFAGEWGAVLADTHLDANALDPNSPAIRASMPPLLKGYLRLGAWVCGPPAHDPSFDCADFCLLLDLRRLSQRHRQHFLSSSR